MKFQPPWPPFARIIPLLLAAALLTACSPPAPPPLQQATLLPSPKPVSAFNLTNQKGEAFTQDNLKGHWTFAFFGYTHCPDICPTSLGILARMMGKLKSSLQPADMPRGLFVSIDPQRDTPQTLAKYVAYFDPDFIAATGAPGEISALTRQLGILYIRKKGKGGDDYEFDHSAAIILFDPSGRYRALFNTPHDADKMASDFLLIRNYYRATQ
jgi:protein SCO1/2